MLQLLHCTSLLGIGINISLPLGCARSSRTHIEHNEREGDAEYEGEEERLIDFCTKRSRKQKIEEKPNINETV